MAINTFLNSHQVFNVQNFEQVFPHSQTDRNLLSRAVRSGRDERVRRGLYVSRSGRFEGVRANPLDVAAGAADDAVFCYLSAFQLHGIAHNVAAVTLFYTRHRIEPFHFDGQSYEPVFIGEHPIDTLDVLTATGQAYRATSKEQTLIDCLARPALAGGPENMLRALSGVAYLDIDKTLSRAHGLNHSARARLGWVLEARRESWHVGDEVIEALAVTLGAGPSYFSTPASPRDAHWVNRWRLYLPFPEEEMLAWLNT
jgi:predicted transcriptional regulator of viral defense system